MKRDRLCRDYDMAKDDHDCTCGHKRGQHRPSTASCIHCLWCDYYQPAKYRVVGPRGHATEETT